VGDVNNYDINILQVYKEKYLGGFCSCKQEFIEQIIAIIKSRKINLR